MAFVKLEYFSVNVGWGPDPTSIKNISQIKFADINKPIVAPIVDTAPSKIDVSGNSTFARRWMDTAFPGLSDVFYQAPAIYYNPFVGYLGDMTAFKNLFPSYDTMYPNSFEYLRLLTAVPPTQINCYIYFPSSKYLFSTTYRWIVGDDGGLTKETTREHILFGGTYSSSNPDNVVFDGVLPMILSDYKTLYTIYYRTVKSGNTSSVNSYGEYTVLSKPLTPGYTPTNPYKPGGESGAGGGDGTFDNNSDEIEKPTLPTLSSAATGFTRIYNPSLSQVNDLANYLWTDESVIQTIWNHIKQFFENPMDAIIGFNILPVPVPNGGTVNFKLMYIDTGVSMTVAANQFVDVDCGTVEIEKYYGSALDYSPYTKVTCFLPYVGNVSLNVDEVMGRTLHVTYRVDICSGSCVAYIQVDGTVLYQYSGHCAIAVPLTGADFSAYVSAAISVGKLAGAALIGGAGVAMAAGAQDAAQQTNQVVTTTQVTTTQRNPTTGRQITTGTVTHVETRESPNDQSSTQASFAGLTPQNIANTVGQVVSSKPFIEHSGSFSGNSGYLGVRRPFIIIERPNMCMPQNYQALNGFPSMITMKLSSCQGYTRIQQVQLTGLPATNPEQAEILELLKSGVIF